MTDPTGPPTGPSNPTPPGGPRFTSPDGPANPLPDPGPHVPKSVGPNEPGAPPSPPPFPPPPKFRRGDAVVYAGRVTVVDTVYDSLTVCTRCLRFHLDYAVRASVRVDGCLVKSAAEPLLSADAGRNTGRSAAAEGAGETAPSAVTPSLRERADEWAARLVGAR